METKCLGAGSYPEPNESEDKYYCVEIIATIKAYKHIYAKNEEEAYEIAKTTKENDYDLETTEFSIEEISQIKEI